MIDTAEKRRAVAHVARMWSGVGLTPNALKDQEWRQEAARGYPGILVSGGGGGVSVGKEDIISANSAHTPLAGRSVVGWHWVRRCRA